MTPPAERFASAAEALVGAPFRLHGRSPETGVDCVGLITCALRGSGANPVSPHGYGLRNSSIETHLHFAQTNGFTPSTGPLARGDMILVQPGPAQQHLLVVLGHGRFVHAHAGLRRVVCDHGLPDAPLLRHWRLTSPD